MANNDVISVSSSDDAVDEVPSAPALLEIISIDDENSVVEVEDETDSDADNFSQSVEYIKSERHPIRGASNSEPIDLLSTSGEEEDKTNQYTSLELTNQDTFRDTDEDVEGAENFPRLLRLEVEQALRVSREQRKKEAQGLLREAIKVNRLLISRTNHQRPQPVTHYAPLPNGARTSTIIKSDYAADHDFPLPKYNNHTILGLKRHIASKAALNPALEQGDSSSREERPPSPVLCPDPMSSEISFNEDSSHDGDISPNKVRYARQINRFRWPHRVGAGTEQDDQEADIKFVLNKVVGSSIDFEQAQRYLAVLIDVEHEVVKSCWLAHGKPGSANPLMKERKSIYENVNNTFRSLSCRSCMIFDCNFHGIEGDQRPANVQMEIFRRALLSNHFQVR